MATRPQQIIFLDTVLQMEVFYYGFQNAQIYGMAVCKKLKCFAMLLLGTNSVLEQLLAVLIDQLTRPQVSHHQGPPRLTVWVCLRHAGYRYTLLYGHIADWGERVSRNIIIYYLYFLIAPFHSQTTHGANMG